MGGMGMSALGAYPKEAPNRRHRRIDENARREDEPRLGPLLGRGRM